MKNTRAGRFILLICGLAFVATAAVAFFAFERLPHLEDEVAYLFQAKTMALGHLTVLSPDRSDAFWTPFVLDHNGQLGLATVDREGLTVLSQCQLTEKWSFTAPTLVGQTLFVRDEKHIMALDLG